MLSRDSARPVRAALEQIRVDAESILAAGREVGVEYVAGTAPFQDQVHVRALVFDLLWNHALMLRQWADRTEASIRQWVTLPAADRAAVVATIQGNLVRDPATGA